MEGVGKKVWRRITRPRLVAADDGHALTERQVGWPGASDIERVRTLQGLAVAAADQKDDVVTTTQRKLVTSQSARARRRRLQQPGQSISSRGSVRCCAMIDAVGLEGPGGRIPVRRYRPIEAPAGARYADQALNWSGHPAGRGLSGPPARLRQGTGDATRFQAGSAPSRRTPRTFPVERGNRHRTALSARAAGGGLSQPVVWAMLPCPSST